MKKKEIFIYSTFLIIFILFIIFTFKIWYNNQEKGQIDLFKKL